MENIYKIKVRSNPDPRGLYPSERRYSASTVLGLAVVHIALATTALLLASLSLTSVNYQNNSTANATNELSISYYNFSAAPCLMSLGALAAGLAGLLAWKRWYIDHNIRWFFFMSLTSSSTSTVSVVLTTMTIITVHEKFEDFSYDFAQKTPDIHFILAINILICCIVELTWSVLSSRVAFCGTRNSYPDDIVISKNKGKIEVNTVHKGNKKARIMPPDILNHFPNGGKMIKYLPKVEAGNLPKAESNSEYQERVRQFLSSDAAEIK